MFDFSVKIGSKEIKFRKWKVKDKINLDKAKTTKEIRDAVVYNCLENPTEVLDDEQYQYVLTAIRNASYKVPMKYIFSCIACGQDFEYKVDPAEVFKAEFKDYVPIKTKNYEIIVQDIRSRESYEKLMTDESLNLSEKELLDFIFHIKSLNKNDAFTFEDILKMIDEIDLDEFTEIFSQWSNMRFRVNRNIEAECPHCKKINRIYLDVLPGFFPSMWNISK